MDAIITTYSFTKERRNLLYFPLRVGKTGMSVRIDCRTCRWRIFGCNSEVMNSLLLQTSSVLTTRQQVTALVPFQIGFMLPTISVAFPLIESCSRTTTLEHHQLDVGSPCGDRKERPSLTLKFIISKCTKPDELVVNLLWNLFNEERVHASISALSFCVM